jgi:hypothetical protein
MQTFPPIHGDREVTQPILKYLLIAAIQFNSILLTDPQYRCNCATAHAGHVMLLTARARPSVVFSRSGRTSFRKRNEC